MTPEESTFAEAMDERLMAYIGERTGFDHDVIARILDAQALFWAERPEMLDEMLGDGDDA